MFEWLRRRKNYKDGVYMPQVLQRLHDFTTYLHSERVA